MGEQLGSYSARVSIQTTRRRSTWRLMPAVPLTVVVLWLAWATAPPSVIPYLGFWFDFGVVPGVVLVALGLVALAMWRGLAPTNTLAWVGLAALGLILGLQALGLWIVLTFPTDF